MNNTSKSGNGINWVLKVALALAFLLPLAALAGDDFLEQRRKFRDEIKNKIETKLDEDGTYLSITFKDDKDKYDFGVTDADRGRLKKLMGKNFSLGNDALLDKMVGELDKGRFVVSKKGEGEAAEIKVLFLSPKVEYWSHLTDVANIEKMFHTYNFSIGLDKPSANSQIVALQTEGTFLGITQGVSLPIRFEWDESEKRMDWRMPSQSEIVKAMDKMEPVKEGNTDPLQKFIDAAREHPYFQMKDGGDYEVGDDDIAELYETIVTDLDTKCPVKSNKGYWKIHEDYPYLVVEYNFSTTVNAEALIPSSLKFLSGTVEDIAQGISDEVSVKYLPLSMKNFRDHSVEWAKTGGPK